MKKKIMLFTLLPIMMLSCGKGDSSKPVVLPEDEVVYTTGQINKEELALIIQRGVYIEKTYMSSASHSTTSAINLTRFAGGYWRYRVDAGQYSVETIAYSYSDYSHTFQTFKTQGQDFDEISDITGTDYGDPYFNHFFTGAYIFPAATMCAYMTALILENYEFNPIGITCVKKNSGYQLKFSFMPLGMEYNPEDARYYDISINKYGGFSWLKEGYLENNKIVYSIDKLQTSFNKRKDPPKYIVEMFKDYQEE